MNTNQNVQVCITRRFAASAERVFDAGLSPELIGQWMFGPAQRDEEIVRITLDPEVGGKFSFVVRRQGEEIDHVGKYREIDRPKRLVFSWGVVGDSEEESFVIIDIVPDRGGCELTLTHEIHPKWAEYADRTKAGWTKMLEALDKTLG